MDLKIQTELSTLGFQRYLVKNYIRTQLEGIIRIVQARYPGYISIAQMNDELSCIRKRIDDLNIEFITNNSTLQQPSSGSNSKQRIRKEVLAGNRCHARVWDATHIVWKLDGRTVYGSQCKNPKSNPADATDGISDGIGDGISNSNYCKKHMRKLTHEDWFNEPSEKMRRHFTSAAGVAN